MKKTNKNVERVLALALCVVLLCTGLTFTSKGSEKDQTFDSFSSWTFDSEGKDSFSFAEGITGNGASVVKTKKGESRLTSDAIMVTSGKKYNAGVTLKFSAGSAKLTVLAYADPEGKKQIGKGTVIGSLESATEFTEITGDYTVPEEADFVRLMISFGNNQSTAGESYIVDNAYLYAYTSAATLYTGWQADGKWFRNGWSNDNSTTRYAQIVDKGYRDDGALHFHNTSPEIDMPVAITVNDVQAGTYTLTFYAKGQTSVPGQLNFIENGHGDAYVGIIDQEKYSDWTKVEKEVQVYADNGVSVFVLYFGQYNWAADLYIDNMTLVNKENGVDVLRGAGNFYNENGYTLTSDNLVVNNGFEDVIYNYLPIDKFNGTFEGAEVTKQEEFNWGLNDNGTGDSIAVVNDVSNGKVVAVTKGTTAEAGQGWVTLSSPLVRVQSQYTYRISFDMKGKGTNPYYVITGYYFDENGNALTAFNTWVEGALSNSWKRTTADVTVPDGAAYIQIRIVCKGAAEDVLYFDNFALNPMKAEASLEEEWKCEGNSSNPDEPGVSQISLEQEGYLDIGSVHFVQNYDKCAGTGKWIAIAQMVKNWEAKTYVFSAWVKGNTQNKGDSAMLEFPYWGGVTWADTGTVSRKLEVNSSDWVKAEYEFTITNPQWMPINILCSSYAGADFYMDNISIYGKDDAAKTNILTNGGFCKTSGEVDTSINLIDNGGFEGMEILSIPGWNVSGNAGYDEVNKAVTLEKGAALTSFRYNVKGGAIYQYSTSARGGSLTFSFDEGASCTVSTAKGYVTVPDNATYMRIIYSAGDEFTSVYSIALEEYEEKLNFQFEVPTFTRRQPYHWNGYHGMESGSEDYIMSWSADEGVDGSGAMKITAQKDNQNSYVVYSARMEVTGSTVYNLSFQGKYKGKDVAVYPLIRMFKADGSEITDESSYNWCNDVLSQDNSNTWKTHTANFTTSADTALIEVRYEVVGRNAGDTFLFDNVVVSKVGSNDDPNLDFEAGVPGAGVLNWNAYQTSDIESQSYVMNLVAGEGIDGSNALKITTLKDNKSSYLVYSIRMATQASTVYNLSFQGKYEGDSVSVFPLIRMYKEDGTETTAASSYNWCDDVLARDNSNTWKTHSANFTTSSDAALVEIRFEIAGPKAGDTFLFDNFKIVKVGSSDNPNLDFETGASGVGVFNWNGYQTAEFEVQKYVMSLAKGQGINGSNAMKMTVVEDNNASYVIYSIRMKAEAATVYNVSFEGNYKGTDIKVAPLIRLFKADGSETTAASSYVWLDGAVSTDNSNTWKTYTSNYTTSSDTAYIEMRWEVFGHKAGAEFLFDNIVITKLGDASNANLDFEAGENGKAVFNWKTYEYRVSSGKEEIGNFGAYTSFKAEHASHDGSAAAVLKKLNTEDVQYYFQSTILEVSPNTYYAMDYDIMVQNAQKNQVMVYVRQYKNAIGDGLDNPEEGHLWLSDAYSYGSFDWKRNGTSFRTAKDAKYLSIFFVMVGTEQSTVYLDNVSLTKATEIQDPNLDFEYTAGGKPVNWTASTASGICEISSSSDVFYRGSKSLHLVKKYSEINITSLSMTRKIPVNPGDSIEFVLHSRSKGAVAGSVSMAVQGFDVNGNEVDVNHGQARVLNTTDNLCNWNEYRLTYRATKNVKQVSLIISINGKQADVYLDSIEFYNYTQNNNTVYAEDFAGPDSDGMFGGWKKETVSGSPAFGTAREASISGDGKDNGAIYTDVAVLNTGYKYNVKGTYRSNGSATGKIVIDALDWRGRVISSVMTQEIGKDGGTAELESGFTALSATMYRIRFEKTGGNGSIYLQNIQIMQVGEPVRNVGWQGNWLVHPDDYDTILGNKHNETYYYLRQEFYLEDDVKSAQIQISADDKYKLYINGIEVYEETGTGETWSMPGQFDLTDYLQKGKNVIAVRMYNNIYAYGIMYDGIVKMENNASLRFVSDDSVMIAKEHNGWTERDTQQFMLSDYDTASCKAWVQADVYCPAGEGPWGIIAFDNTEYSEYKIESNEFKFPQGEIKAGETITIQAKIKIDEPLPTDSSFEIYYWKKNTTKKICTGTMTIAGGKSTDDWPIGKEFTAKFELKIPEFLATDSYTIQFDDMVSVISDYYVGNKVGSIKVVQPKHEVTTTSEIKMVDGKPTYYLNGIPTTSLWYGRPENDTVYKAETLTKAGEAGVDTVICYICLSGSYGEVWLEDGTIDSVPIDQQILGTLSGNPDAYLQVAIDTTAPNWWLEQNPDECVKLSNGKLSKQTFSSMKWRQECGEIVKQILDYLMEQPYANNIAGIKLTGGSTYEWQWWGMNGQPSVVGDFSTAGLNEYRNWLQEKYQTNEALRKSWKNNSVTFETAQVPSIEARSASQYRSILSVQDSRDVIDYQLFMADMQADTILYFADLVKEHLNNRLVVGTYMGYLLNCGTYEFATTTAEAALDRLLRSDSIDWVQTPWLYGEREIGTMTDYMGAMDSVTAHGKLVVVEEDSRLNMYYIDMAQDARASVGATRTMKESVEVLKRNFCYVLSKGQSLDFYDLGGGYFDDDQIYGLMSQMSQESTLSLGLERKSTSEVAVFMDPDMANYFVYHQDSDYKCELLYKSLLNKQREELQNIGAPYDIYLLQDLVDGLVPEHKVNIMLATTQITDVEREAIEKHLEKNGNVILWVFLTGITDGNKTDISLMSDIVGMNLGILNVDTDTEGYKLIGTVDVTNYDHWLTKGMEDVSYGAIEYATLSPVIAVKDSKAVTIGVHEKTGLDGDYTGLAVKEMTNADGSKWTSIYSAVPTFPTALIRNIMKHTGCHIYDESSSDIVFADSNYVAVHSLFAGERTIYLPDTYAVYDVFNREIITGGSNSFTFTMDGAETRLFRLSEPDTVQCYITHTVGGSTDKKELITLNVGEDLTFGFTAEKGYKLNYLLVDGEKVVPERDYYTFKDVKESHTVIAKFAKTSEQEVVEASSGINWSLIIILICSALLLILIVIIIVYYYRKRKKALPENMEKE